MAKEERFQTHCKKCFAVFEADTVEEVVVRAIKHEVDCKDIPRPPGKVKSMENL